MATGKTTDVHLVVCLHGLWGNPGHLKYLVTQLNEKHGEKIHILNSKNNTTTYTYDGIDICGDRLIEEINEEINNLKEDGRKIIKFSIIGYSLGGLISRYAIGILHQEGFFKEIQPWLFTTFVTPHLGIQLEPQKTTSKIFNWTSSRILSKTGEQLQWNDKYENDLPILTVLSDPEQIFFKALELFKYRKLYANAKNDRTVPFWTASISEVDPFLKFNELSLTKNSKFNSIVESISKKDEQENEAFITKVFDVTKNLTVYSLIALVIPIWLVVILSTISVQGIISRRRVYKIIENRAKKGNNENNENRTLSALEIAASDLEEGGIETLVNIKNILSLSEDQSQATETFATSNNDAQIPLFSVSPDFPRLQFMESQLKACENLNKLQFEKYTVYIDSINAHAAVVVRNSRFNRVSYRLFFTSPRVAFTQYAATYGNPGDEYSLNEFRSQKKLPRNTIINFVPQQEAWIVERFGKFHRLLQPGLAIVIPIVDRIRYVKSLKEICLNIPAQSAITQDNVTLELDGVLYIKVVDPYKASYGVEDAEYAVAQLAQTTMRAEIGQMTLDRTLAERALLNANIVEAINSAAEAWGIRCLRYEIRDIHPPAKVVESMHQQVSAERSKRASILESEGQRQAAINVAEGSKQSVILASEAVKSEQVNRASGEAQAIILRASATAQGIRRIAESISQSSSGIDAVSLTIAEKYVDAFGQLAKQGTSIIVPASTSDAGSMIAQV
ncbi:hypothetical protein G9A89_020950 [Geosiphon pyriformis]|nr:hypothetical protein G9A89_020950 [Geosiphon pyriformis]